MDDVKARIMYLECKSGTLAGQARIARVSFSTSGRTVYCGDLQLRHLPYPGADGSNHYDVDTEDTYWVSGPKKDGGDRLYGRAPVHVEADARQEYWSVIRALPHRVGEHDAAR